MKHQNEASKRGNALLNAFLSKNKVPTSTLDTIRVHTLLNFIEQVNHINGNGFIDLVFGDSSKEEQNEMLDKWERLSSGNLFIFLQRINPTQFTKVVNYLFKNMDNAHSIKDVESMYMSYDLKAIKLYEFQSIVDNELELVVVMKNKFDIRLRIWLNRTTGHYCLADLESIIFHSKYFGDIIGNLYKMSNTMDCSNVEVVEVVKK